MLNRLMATCRKRLAGQAGFGLIEAIVATLMLAVGALALFGVFDSSSKAATATNREEVAANQAERQIEWIRTRAYKEVWMASVPAAGVGSANPLSRISGSGVNARYAVGGDTSRLEELVSTATTTGAQRTGTGIAPGPTSFSVATGTGQQITGKIYTFVSWRDEECPLVNLGPLQDSVTSINSSLNANVSGLLNQLNGVIGLVNSLSNQATGTLRNNLTGQNGLLNLVTTVNTQLDALTATSGYTNLLNGGIDLCDIGNVGALEAIQDIRNATNAIAQLPTDVSSTSGIASTVSGLLGGLGGLLGSLVCPPPPLLAVLLQPTCNALTSLNTSSGIFNTHIGGSGGISATLTSLSTDLTTLTNFLSNPNVTRNTKRVSVAVTIDSARSDIAPQLPIWLSTVVTDSTEGLL